MASVNAQHLPGRASALGERDRARTGTAADQDRTQDDVLRLLAFDPMAAASAIPVRDFSFILCWVCRLITNLYSPWHHRIFAAGLEDSREMPIALARSNIAPS
jgi:hypothetical protein